MWIMHPLRCCRCGICRLGVAEHPSDVDRHDAVEVLEGRSERAGEHADAGVVHQDVEAAELRDRPFDRGVDLRSVGGVGTDERRLAHLAQRRFRACSVPGVAAGDHDAGSLAQVGAGDLETEPGGPARDERGPILQLPHRRLPDLTSGRISLQVWPDLASGLDRSRFRSG
jgi:hypothetical protein